jgi:hypothetical protein
LLKISIHKSLKKIEMWVWMCECVNVSWEKTEREFSKILSHHTHTRTKHTKHTKYTIPRTSQTLKI